MKVYLKIKGCSFNIWIVIFCLVVLMLSCSTEKPGQKIDTTQRTYPSIEYQDTTLIQMHEKSQLMWELKTQYMSKSEKTKRLFVRPVNIAFYDSVGHQAAMVTSDSGAADEGITFVSVWGRVYAESDSGLKVEADSLVWKKKTKDIRTDGWVKVVTQDGDTLTGVGFISDDQLDNWKILSDIRTVIQKVEERVQEVDNNEGDTTDNASEY